MGKGAKPEKPEPVQLQHASTTENVNEDVSHSISPQKGEMRPSESAFLSKKATKITGYYLCVQHQKPREPQVQKTQA